MTEPQIVIVVQVVGLVRNQVRIPRLDPRRKIRANDILLIEAEPESLAESLSVLELPNSDLHGDQSGNQRRPLSDVGRSRGFVRISHADGPSEQ